MGGETDNLPTRRRTNSALVGSSNVIEPKKENSPTRVRCRYYYVGCGDLIESHKYAQHMEDNQQEHMRLLERTVALQSRKISQLEDHSAVTRKAGKLEQPPAAPLHVPPQLAAAELLNVLAHLANAHVYAIVSSVKEFMRPRPEDADHHNTVWFSLHLLVLSFLSVCYFSLAAKGGPLMLLQFMPLFLYGTLMGFHWRYAPNFSSSANFVLSLAVIGCWGGLCVFLPVF
jgi:hypothetical protein